MCMHMCTRETGGKEKKEKRENRIKGREKEGHIQPKGGMGGRHAATTTTQAQGFSREGRWVASRRPPFAWASKEGKENRQPKERRKENKPNEGWDEDRVPTCTSRTGAGFWKDDQGHRGTGVNSLSGVGSASRHGGELGRVHPHDRVPGIPLSYRKLHAAPGEF